MGQVYRATDTVLKRQVALKVLPIAVAGDPERVARFRREAEILASLNHPHIAGIHGLEESDGVSALVMELVDGEDLSQRLARGAMPIEEALPIAKQIAEALEAAHERGIIHRDLKPANIKLRADGTVKVLDFGLAKLAEPAAVAGAATLTQSPTITTPAMTAAGIILGTAAYMSPEQARGKVADRRADIWAFGCVLYEMLTGRRAFDGDDISTTLAAVLKTDPEWSALPLATPPSVRRLLGRCLDKDLKERLQAIGEARVAIGRVQSGALEESASLATVHRTPWWRRAMPAAISAAAVGLITGAAWTLMPPSPVSVVRFPIVLPEDQQTGLFAPDLALAPDGARLAYVTRSRLYVRALNEIDARAITDAAQAPREPFFSPDGQWIGFYSIGEQALKKVAVTGGAPVTICKIRGAFSATWEGDRILFFQPGKGIMHVSANGGDPEVVIATQASEMVATPQLLDGGTAVLFTLAAPGSLANWWDRAQVVVQSVGSPERKVVWHGSGGARYLPSGHLLYTVGNVLFAAPFDLKRREVRGAPVRVVEGLQRSMSFPGVVPAFAVSRNGSLIYVPGGAATTALSTLALVSRDGRVQPLDLPPQPYRHPRISPDGHNLVFDTDDGQNAVIWIYGLGGGGPPRQLTFGGRNRSPIWTPDGRRITFASDRDGTTTLFWQAADGSGTAERLMKGEPTTSWRPEAWTPDGKTLAFTSDPGAAAIWTLTLGGESKPQKLVESSANVRFTEFSRDGRWLTYSSTESRSGQTNSDIFVQPFPPTGAKYRLTTTGARTDVWSPDGKELVYVERRADLALGAGQLVAVEVRTLPTFNFGKPTRLPIGEGVQFVGTGRQYDITPDGKQFIVVLDASTSASPDGTRRPPPTQINVVLNWMEELKQRVPTR